MYIYKYISVRAAKYMKKKNVCVGTCIRAKNMAVMLLDMTPPAYL